jgi:hypothetical protein
VKEAAIVTGLDVYMLRMFRKLSIS